MALKLITAPTSEPLTLDEAKSHLHVDHTTDDALIQIYLAAARDDCERWTGRAFMPQTWELTLDQFPTGEVLIPKPPLQSVSSIKYDDASGTEQTLATSQYTVDSVSQPGWVVPVPAGWPTTTFEGVNSVRIRYSAGYASAADVPGAIKAAILLMLGTLYDNREDVVVGTSALPLPLSAQYLLRPLRVSLGMA
jgi:uncharacterized phiE125 gp8 family phage protein